MHPYAVERYIVGPGLVMITYTNKETGELYAVTLEAYKAGSATGTLTLQAEDMDLMSGYWQGMRERIGQAPDTGAASPILEAGQPA